MKSAFNLLLLALLVLFLGACNAKNPHSLKVNEDSYSAPKAKFYRAYVAYIPTEITTRYTITPSLRAMLQPHLESLSNATAKAWNRHFPHLLASKGIGIRAQFPSVSILTKQDRAAHEGLFYSTILAQVSQPSPLTPLERTLESQAFLLSLQAELKLIEPYSGEILWEARSLLREVRFETPMEFDVKELEVTLRHYYRILEQEMIAHLERTKGVDLANPIEEMRLMRGLPSLDR